MTALRIIIFCGFIWPAIGYRYQPWSKITTTRLKYEKKSNDLVETELQLIVDPVSNTDVNKMLEEMSMPEKYYLLLQSYGGKIMEGAKKDSALFDKMEALFDSMLQKSIAPDDKSAQYLLDSAALFGRVEVMTKALRLTKKGGRSKAFGVINGQLTSPMTKSVQSSMLTVSVPTDNRGKEVFLAASLMMSLILWIFLQVTGVFVDELHPYTTLYTVLCTSLGAYDVVLRGGAELKQAVAGLERLVLKDEERQAHVDASAFLAGYLLGLPCFPYKPDVREATKMAGEAAALTVYQQQLVRSLKANKGGGKSDKETKEKGGMNFERILGEIKGSLGGGKGKGADIQQQSVTSPSQSPLPLPGTPVIDEEDQVFNIGRVLIWLLTPVAAEQLRYGQTVISDPRRAPQFLQTILTKTSPSSKPATSDPSSMPTVLPSPLPIPRIEDQSVYMQWAYFEATQLVRQYGDLIEKVGSYLRTGTTTVGECALLIEDELT
eukprot:gene31596-38184_t